MKRRLALAAVAAALLLPAADLPGKYRPVIAGPYRVLFQPERYGDTMNDHTVFQDAHGDWRMIGIHSKGLNLLETPSFAHAVGPSLETPLTELEPLFGDYPDSLKKWAPHVIVEQGVYHLFAGPRIIRHYTSPDGINWTFREIVIESDWKDLRDTMVLKAAPGKFLMYATCHDNSVIVYESPDLWSWSEGRVVFHAIKPAPVYPSWVDISACESPFVIFYEGYYYLAVCLTAGLIPSSYSNTVVVRSEDPYDFGVYARGGPGETSDYVTTLAAHAAEYIRDDGGRWWITSAGWRMFPTPKGAVRGALNIAPLEWERE